MGTRGLCGFKINNKYKLMYNHFDSYPKGGLGEDIVHFIKHLNDKNDWNKFKENASKVVLVNEINDKPSMELQDKYLKYSDINVGSKSLSDWYCLLRNVQGAELLWQIFNGKLQHLIDDKDFIYDSVFCEYAYIIDLDNNTLELYVGFQNEPQDGNPFGNKKVRGNYPCKLVNRFTINNIPNNWIELTYENVA